MMSNFFSSELLKNLNIIEFGYTEDSIATSYENYRQWVDKSAHGNLSYLQGDRMLLREDIKKYYPEFKSAFVFLFDYAPEKRELEKLYSSEKSNSYKIGSYTLIDSGTDYHLSIRNKLQKIGNLLKQKKPKLKFRLSLDTQPILERDLAYRAGLGFFGKNSILLFCRWHIFYSFYN